MGATCESCRSRSTSAASASTCGRGRRRQRQSDHAGLPRDTRGFPQLRDDVLEVAPHEILEPMARNDQLAALAVDMRQMRLGGDDAFEARIRACGHLRRHGRPKYGVDTTESILIP